MGSTENIATIAAIISDYPDIPLIIDPVLASGRGDEFSDIEARNMMMELLFPESLLITPNSLEARQLVAMKKNLQTYLIETMCGSL